MTGSNRSDDQDARRSRGLVLVLVGVIVLSFTFGVAMFLPEENRAYKLQETLAKYQARRRGP